MVATNQHKANIHISLFNTLKARVKISNPPSLGVWAKNVRNEIFENTENVAIGQVAMLLTNHLIFLLLVLFLSLFLLFEGGRVFKHL